MYCAFLEILHPHYDLALCLSPVSYFTLQFLLCFLFLPALISIPSHFQFLISPVFRCPFCLVFNSFTPFPFIHCVPFYIPASLNHSDSFLLCFTPLHGQVAEQLAYYVHVSETVITEETFDAAVQFGDPTRS